MLKQIKLAGLTGEALEILAEMVADYGFNRCDEKRIETINKAKKIIKKIREVINHA